MHDYESAAWVDNRHHLSALIARLGADTMRAFRQLNRIRYDAPWHRPGPRRRPSCRP